jgi:outer membrane lipoprotein-sorting protein
MRMFTALVVLAAALLSRSSSAQPPDADLLARLAIHAAAIERMRTHASYAIEGELDSLDGDGKVDSVKKMTARIVADGERTRLVVVKCTEDGKDTTEDARKDARAGNEKTKEQRAKDHVEMPFVAEAQPHYVFDQIAVDAADPARVQISFVPKEPNEHTSEGSVWVDTKTGTLLSAGFKLSKPGFFVEYVHLTIELGAKTELGPAISRVTVDGKGGILFLRKHFRGEATLSGYTILP